MNILTYNLYDSFNKNSLYCFDFIERKSIRDAIYGEKIQTKISNGELLGYITHQNRISGDYFHPVFIVTRLSCNENADVTIEWEYINSDIGRDAEQKYNSGWRMGCASLTETHHLSNLLISDFKEIIGFDIIEK